MLWKLHVTEKNGIQFQHKWRDSTTRCYLFHTKNRYDNIKSMLQFDLFGNEHFFKVDKKYQSQYLPRTFSALLTTDPHLGHFVLTGMSLIVSVFVCSNVEPLTGCIFCLELPSIVFSSDTQLSWNWFLNKGLLVP